LPPGSQDVATPASLESGMITTSRVDLKVPYAEKNDAKKLGARWDPRQQTWYAPPGLAIGPFDRWLPKTPQEPAEEDDATDEGVSLSAFLKRVRDVIQHGLADAQWVRMEIREIREKDGNLYLSVEERNPAGDVLATSFAMIWRSRSGRIVRKFKDATGEGLRTGIKVLVLVRAQFHPLYGFSLAVEDIDPSYTLGDLEAKLRKIRETLAHERIIQLNRLIPSPVEFVRVAVISPETSAGLGDFRQEADRLHRAGLCEFHFVRATFQGPAAPSSLLDAIETVLSAHRERPFDALVIIRGGGAVTDLAWLNDLELARRICRLPIPVLTGIGHERDSTILDEVAHRRFDTPSKAAHHIAQVIRDNALAALADLERIGHQVRRILVRHGDRLAAEKQRIEARIRLGLAKAEAGVGRLGSEIRMGSAHQIESASQLLGRADERIRLGSDRAIERGGVQLAGAWESVKQTAGLGVERQTGTIDQIVQAVALKASKRIELAGSEIDRDRERVVHAVGHRIALASNRLGDVVGRLARGAESIRQDAGRRIEFFVQRIVGLGPEATLRRGYAIVRDEDGRPLGSRKQAEVQPVLELEFQDGRLRVENQAVKEPGQ
jgi:exodeoxyribonuclease VII large subunit